VDIDFGDLYTVPQRMGNAGRPPSLPLRLRGMKMDVSKKDWKLFRELLPVWQERFMERLLAEYAQIISGDGAASDRFWSLDDRMKRDKESPGVLISPSKSNLPWDLARMIHDGIITMDDMNGFTDDLIDSHPP